MESNLFTENTWIKPSAPVSLTLTLPTAMKEACKVERTSTPVPKDKVGSKGNSNFALKIEASGRKTNRRRF